LSKIGFIVTGKIDLRIGSLQLNAVQLGAIWTRFIVPEFSTFPRDECVGPVV
jgi:hypothetical protein